MKIRIAKVQIKILIIFNLTEILFGYIKFDNVTVHNDEKISGSKVWLSRSYDKHVAIINLDTMYHHQIERELQRINISLNADENDFSYSRPYIYTTLSPCKFTSGTAPSFFRLLLDDNKEKVTLSCPYIKGQHYPVLNVTITDSFLPPMPMEIRFKLESRHYGIIKKKKGWNYMFSFTLYGRYKR